MTRRRLAVPVLAAGLLAASWGVVRTRAGDDAPPTTPKSSERPPDLPPTPSAAKHGKPDPRAAEWAKEAAADRAVRAKLAADVAGKVPAQLKLIEFCDLMAKEYGLPVRVDVSAVQRLRTPPEDAAPGEKWLYDAQIALPITAGMTVADLLADVTAQLPKSMTYRVSGRQVLIGPAYMPQAVPNAAANGSTGEDLRTVERRVFVEQMTGPPVSVAFEAVPLGEALAKLRRLTGANVVLKDPAGAAAALPVTATFDDVRLFTALEILADMADLRPAVVGNVFYLTDDAAAQRLQTKANRELYGDPPAAAGAGGGVYLPSTAGLSTLTPAAPPGPATRPAVK